MAKNTPKLNLIPPEGLSAPCTGSATGNPRNKVSLKPGRSLMDWIRLGHSGRDLTGVGGQVREVTRDELAKHDQQTDAWICLKGKVYNVTAYMEFHPGGEIELMKGVGKDATAIFNQVHQWVNAESMLQKCLVGYLDSSPLTLLAQPSSAPVEKNRKRVSQPEVPTFPSSEAGPGDLCWSWHQTEACVILAMTVPRHKIEPGNIIVHHDPDTSALHCRVVLPHHVYHFAASLPHRVDPEVEVLAVNEADGVRLKLTKAQNEGGESTWTRIEKAEENDKNYLKAEDRTSGELAYHRCTLGGKWPVTHDTRLFRLDLPRGTSWETPLGRHVNVRVRIEGGYSEMEVCRSYTPVPGGLDPVEEQPDMRRKRLFLMVKIYPEGTLTPHLDTLHIGDVVDISDPLGRFEAQFLDRCHHLVLLAAGTGLTPMVKLIQWALLTDERRTVKLMFFNKREKDILWKSKLDDLAEKNPRLDLCYVLSEPEVTWKGPVGRVRKGLLEAPLSSVPQEVTYCCVCGPRPFTQLCLSILEEMKFPDAQVHAFQA